jgi:hypothetical protein
MAKQQLPSTENSAPWIESVCILKTLRINRSICGMPIACVQARWLYCVLLLGQHAITRVQGQCGGYNTVGRLTSVFYFKVRFPL